MLNNLADWTNISRMDSTISNVRAWIFGRSWNLISYRKYSLASSQSYNHRSLCHIGNFGHFVHLDYNSHIYTSKWLRIAKFYFNVYNFKNWPFLASKNAKNQPKRIYDLCSSGSPVHLVNTWRCLHHTFEFYCYQWNMALDDTRPDFYGTRFT